MIRSALGSILLLIAASVFADSADIDKVNGAIHVADGGSAGKLSTVNGSIRVGATAQARSAETVNGGIDVGAGAHLDTLETVNGGVRIGAGAKIAKTVETVNGSITLDESVDVAGKVSNVNGSIKLSAAHIGGGIETSNGDITVGANSRVEGGIFLDADQGFHFMAPRKPHIVIGPHAVVDGALIFKREVELYVSDSATVGAIEGATAVKFSGETPAQ